MADEAMAIRWDLLPWAYGQGLDLGCGDSRPHDFMIGVDWKPGTGQRGPNFIADVTKPDVRNMGLFSAESQDYIFSSHVLNEVSDVGATLKLWWEKIKPDGYLILFLPITEQCNPKAIVDLMLPLRPWQPVDMRTNGDKFFHVYRKCDKPSLLDQPKPEKICAVMKLGAHGDALWASSVLPHLKDQGYHVVFYCQDTGEEVLRHDPHIDQMIKFESRVPIDQLGELFRWMEQKYDEARILVECVEGTLLPAPSKIQYHHPMAIRSRMCNINYVEMHHLVAKVPLEPRVKFYPNDDEKRWANSLRSTLQQDLIIIVPNGSSLTKYWPYAAEFVRRILAERENLTVVMLGDERGCVFDDHPRFLKLGISLDIRKAMTFCQLADVVIGQETGLLNSVSHESDIYKIVLLSHSSVENLTRDWPNTYSFREMPECASTTSCHRLHYDWTYCNKDEKTGSAMCQSMIQSDTVIKIVNVVLDGKASKQSAWEDIRQVACT